MISEVSLVSKAVRAIDEETGIIRWLSEIPIEPGEPEIFNYSAKMADTGRYLPLKCYDNNGGAGLTREDAVLAAVGESLERYCCSIYFIDELRLGSHAEVSRRSRALSPAEIGLFHLAQRSQVHYDWFTEQTPIAWTQGVSITHREPLLLPACLCYVPYFPFLRDNGERTVAPSISTGQACGRSYTDALLRGLYEVIERDAFNITWLNQLTVPHIDIASSSRVNHVYKERFARPYLQYGLHQLASDFGIPCVLCILIDHSRRPPMICTGGAAHLDPERAALKAMVEAAQTRVWAQFLGKSREPRIIEDDYSNITDFEQHVYLYAYGGMLPAVQFLLSSDEWRSFRDFDNVASFGGVEELQRSLQMVQAAGCEVMAIDLTTPDVRELGFRVVKVIIPLAVPLEGDHNHRLLGSPRIFQVPARLGYRSQSDLTKLNPYPHPYP